MAKSMLSRHSLHRSVDLTPAHRAAMQKATAELIRTAPAPTGAPTNEFPLKTVSFLSNFDAYIDISYPGAAQGFSVELMVDSGNSVLIVPRWEDIQAIPGYQNKYQVLGQATEPWSCPANVVRGPIELIGSNGLPLVIPNCIFYACTGNPPKGGDRTANFGTGCLNPWTASAWNTPPNIGVTMQAPLSYTQYPVVEFDYEASANVMPGGAGTAMATNSILRLHSAVPPGYRLFDLVPGIVWMSLIPKSLSIAGTPTQWPGPASGIAMVDTGGGPVFLSDPDGYVYSKTWPDGVANPDLPHSANCHSTEASIGVEIGDRRESYSYTIDDKLPQAAQGLTLVMCERNEYMMDQRGMNIGGISALVNYILIDFANHRVGRKPK
jgi:hypothetical protein